ncbi:PspA/IM30 family protein [Evansella sp. LMS18]|uniref:PspA/IM30 family protein n=1 Tax=Evansella sp. LMS18 TaxID=2924033 RepID=UPI0020D098D6|nr:PspA/IM30 family protein [Evansella sp. LMS18]UTR11262.1 PspA/IM30 family protein [Evansella sp. LMS18]
MFSIFLIRRLTKNLTKISGVFKKDEEPEELLEQYIAILGEKVNELEEEAIQKTAEEKLLARRIEAAADKIKKREKQALKALSTGRNDFARRVIEDKTRITGEKRYLETLHASARDEAAELNERLFSLKKSYQEILFKREQLQNKVGTTKTNILMNEALSTLDISNGGNAGNVKKGPEEEGISTEVPEDRKLAAESVHTDSKWLQDQVDQEMLLLKKKLHSSKSE